MYISCLSEHFDSHFSRFIFYIMDIYDFSILYIVI